MASAPTPDAGYLTQANNTPFAKAKPQRLLIILDLNGTLVWRKKGGTGHVRRPHLDEFFRYCLSKHAVMIWSSATPPSVNGMVDGMLSLEERKKLVAVWDRERFGLSDAMYATKVQVYKQLKNVWEDEVVQAHKDGFFNGELFDQTNTVLIDDSYLKASGEPFNHIEVPEFHGSMVELEETTRPVLRELTRYLEEASHFEDVSTFIRAHPFNIRGVVEGSAAPAMGTAPEAERSSEGRAGDELHHGLARINIDG